SRVRDLFEQAKKHSPSIVFIDEIDAVGRQRGAGLGGGNDEREQTLNQLLVELDGFGVNEGVIVIAATNRRDVLDPALLRPGRFDREVYVGYPDIKGREEILKVHSRNKPLGPDVDLKVIARQTAGFTGADLANLLNEAALLAARRNKKALTMADVEEATIKVVAGPEKKSRQVTEKDRKLTAYHEAGHAVVTYFCETQDPVHQISIVPRGMAGGFTMSLPTDDTSYRTRKEMFENIVTLLGGRIAESLILDDISTGASNDLERATAIAKAMVTRYGFSESIGPIVYGTDPNEVFLGRDIAQNRNFSEETASRIDREIRRVIEEAYNRCEEILKAHTDKLHTVSDVLMEYDKIDGETFKKLMEQDAAPSQPAEQTVTETEITVEENME
ncbi:MAG: AAA family ATPase, partial [Oscillospiraceae bacterium]|nr:AAA family ATPase [Oscillospiraceae bacterium]